MTFEEIDSLARGAGTLPRGHPLEDVMCLMTLQCLYERYRQGRVRREDAAREKQSVRRAFDENVRERNRQRAMYCQYQENIRQAEMLMHQISRGVREGIEIAELFVLASRCIAAMTHNQAFHEENLKILKQNGLIDRPTRPIVGPDVSVP